MKKRLFTLTAILALTGGAPMVHATEVLPPTGTETVAVCNVSVAFDSNGGNGSMNSLEVASNTTATLTANAFSRSGFTFQGWNTKADGTGTAYVDMADVTTLATAENHGQTVTLYAQWKLNKPTIKKVSKATPASIKVTYKKNTKVAGYEIQYGTKKNFKNAKSVTAKKSSKSTELTDLIPGKKYYIRMRSYVKQNGKKVFSDWSDAKSLKLKKVSTIANTKSHATIEADVTLTGSGTGYHAKLVICTATSAVSYGIQYDACAVAPYTGKAMALIENVAHNNAGGQTYTRPGNKELKLGKTYHMMMTIDKKGNGNVYLDYKKIGSFKNSGLANQYLYLRVEGSARLNGDHVKAVFKNVKCKNGGTYYPDKVWGMHEFKTNNTLKNKVKNGTITISGYISGLPAGGDWDNQYGSVSDIIQFVE